MTRRFATLLTAFGLLGAFAVTAAAVAPGFAAEFEADLHGFGGGSS
jgi:hypothetical protein